MTSFPEGVDPEVVRALVIPMLKTAETVYVGACCGRVFAGVDPPQGCRNHPDRELQVLSYKVGDLVT